MLNPIPKFIHFLDYFNFGALFDIFLWSMCQNLCNLALVICLLIWNWENLYKAKFFYWLNHGTNGVDHWVTYWVSPLEFIFQGQSYSSFHSGWSLAWDHVRGDIDDPCGVIADFCGVAFPEAIRAVLPPMQRHQ